MRRSLVLLPLLIVLVAGCASAPPKHVSPVSSLFPDEGMLVQRVVFSALRRQFPLNGYLALSATRGKRLVLTESFGAVMADVLIKPDGKVFVMRASPMFPARYIRRRMAADVQCAFGGFPGRDCPVTMLDTNHFLIKRGWYKVDVRTVETKTGRQPDSVFDETTAKK